MKIVKELQKNCILLIKEKAVTEGYKTIQNTIYKVDGEYVVFVDYLIVNSKELVYRINVKKKSYDNIFWLVMGMENNIKKGDALRVNGAFAAPAVLISKGSIELIKDIDSVVDSFLQIIKRKLEDFDYVNEIQKCIFSDEAILDADILRCLEYIDTGLLSKAKDVAREKVQQGETGRFENEGKGFFERVLLYDKVF